jgi:hypothetical protein
MAFGFVASSIPAQAGAESLGCAVDAAVGFSLVGATVASEYLAYSLAVDKPTGVQEGDIMFAWVLRRKPTTETPPSGWDLIRYESVSAIEVHLYYKVAGNSEPSSYTWSWSDDYQTLVQIAAYRGGFDQSDPIDAHAYTEYIVNDVNCVAAGISVSAPNSPLLMFAVVPAITATTFTAPSGFTEDHDSGSTAPDIWAAIFHKISDSGATGDQTAVLSQSLASKIGILVSLNPLSGSTPATATCLPAEAGAESTVCTVDSGATPVTVDVLPAQAGADSGQATAGAGCTVSALPAPAGAEGTILDVLIVKIIDSLVADAGGQGLVVGVTTGCTVEASAAQSGAEGLTGQATTGLVVEVFAADAGADALGLQVQAGVLIATQATDAAAEGLVATVTVGGSLIITTLSADAGAQGLVVQVGMRSGLRRTYPAMVRAYPPLCRAA